LERVAARLDAGHVFPIDTEIATKLLLLIFMWCDVVFVAKRSAVARSGARMRLAKQPVLKHRTKRPIKT